MIKLAELLCKRFKGNRLAVRLIKKLIVKEEASKFRVSHIQQHRNREGNRNVNLSWHCGFNPCNPAISSSYCLGSM